jgi:hypothetical protein
VGAVCGFAAGHVGKCELLGQEITSAATPLSAPTVDTFAQLNILFKTLKLVGTCPDCGYRALNFHVDQSLTLTWACWNGCNP